MSTEESEAENPEKPRHTQPVCKIPAGSYGNNRWFVYSPTLRRIIVVASGLEFDAWVTIEACRNTKWLCEQPRRVQVKLPSGLVTTIFDFWIQRKDRTEEYWEIKYYSQVVAAHPRLVRQIEAQRTWCEIHSFTYVLLTDLVIRSNPTYLENWKTILHVLAMTADLNLNPITKKIVRLLLSAGQVTISQIEQMLAGVDRTLVRAALFLLLHRGEVTAPLDTEVLRPSMLVELEKQ